MKITDGLEILDLPGMQGSGPIHPAVLWDSENAVLVDTGFPGQIACIRDGMKTAGVPFERLSKIILTHADLDHTGSLRSILQALPHPAQVIAHANEKPYIEGKLPPVRAAQMEAVLKLLPGEKRLLLEKMYNKLITTYRNFSADVTKTVEDGETLPCCGGIRVIHTPGHTPGHIALYLDGPKVLIAGDLMNVEKGVLVPAPDFTTADKKRTQQSMQKLLGLDIRTVVCYHGGVFRGNAAARIAFLAGGN